MDLKTYLKEFYISQNGEVITPDLAKLIVEDFAVTDNSGRCNGEKWTYEDCVKLGTSLNLDWSVIPKTEWYIVCNNEYSDKFRIVQKYKLPYPEVYLDFALSWFNDVDGKQSKTFRFFFD